MSRLREIVEWLKRKEPSIFAALCTARAQKTSPSYRRGEEYPILAMIKADELQLEEAIRSLLESNGWSDVAIHESKRLEIPFFSKDHEVSACYVNAATSDGGYIVYTDPVDEREMLSYLAQR